MPTPALERRLAAILSADVAGYSRLMGEDDDATVRTLTVTKETLEGLPGIPWENIIGMRNRLIHGYFDIDLDILWQTIKEDLPPLVTRLEGAVLPEEK